MTKKLFLAKREQIKKEYENSIADLGREFALSNNKYKVGDIFEDHIGKVKIVSISPYNIYSDKPTLLFNGIVLLKNGTENKRGDKREAFLSNDIASN